MLHDATIKLAQWARLAGVHPRTAYRWFHDGLLAVPARQLATGTILVDPPVSAPGEVDDDLVGDMVEVGTCMCARLYGRRSARRRAQRAVAAAGQAST